MKKKMSAGISIALGAWQMLEISLPLQSKAYDQESYRNLQLLYSRRACRGCKLEGLDLVNAHLPGVDLSNSSLAGSNLNGAMLDGVNLNGANLTRTSLHRASLSNADLRNTILSSTDLSGAILWNANIPYNRLARANTRGAIGIESLFETPDHFMQAGEEALKQNNFRAAESFFGSALTMDSVMYKAWLGRGMARMAMADITQAVADLGYSALLASQQGKAEEALEIKQILESARNADQSSSGGKGEPASRPNLNSINSLGQAPTNQLGQQLVEGAMSAFRFSLPVFLKIFTYGAL